VYGLTPKFKEIVIMRYYLDMEYQDIAHTIGLPLGTVKSRLNRAMSALQKELGGDFNE
jgi:RNA polymerase sigma-70 factor (ECF subfamily)